MKALISASPGFYVFFSMCFLSLPLSWLVSLGVAAAFHEFGHILALCYLRLPVCGITFSFGGARIHTVGLTPKQELLVASAGPLVGVLLVSLFPWIPQISLCALMQTLFNLLPIRSFDGGRILRCARSLLQG